MQHHMVLISKQNPAPAQFVDLQVLVGFLKGNIGCDFCPPEVEARFEAKMDKVQGS